MLSLCSHTQPYHASGLTLRALRHSPPGGNDQWIGTAPLIIARNAVTSRFGGYANTTIAEWLDGMRKFSLTGLEKEINCPLLVIAGEGEFDSARIEMEISQWRTLLNHPKSQIRIGTTSEGGEGHSVVNNLFLKNQIEMDWLDETLDWKS